MKRSKKVAAGIAVLAIVGVSGLAFANGGFGGGGYHMGMGSGDHMMGYNGYDNHMGVSGNGYHRGYSDYGRGQRFSDDQREKINQASEDFLKASNEIRNEADQRQLELRSELGKENPDADKMRKIQKDLSGLEADLAQKRLDHELKIRKIIPESSRGYVGRGYGHGFGGRYMD